MKKLLFILTLLTLLCVPWVTNAQTTITIGEGTSAQNFPLPGYWGYQYDVFLYTPTAAAALEVDCDISSIAFNVKTNSTTNGAEMYIWVKDVDADYALAAATTFSEYTDDATQVYENDAFSSTAGWNTFAFTRDFSHEGGKALLVAVRAVGCTTSGGCSRQCYYTTASNTYWYKRADSNDPGTEVSGTLSSNRANIQLTLTYTGAVCLTPSGLDASNFTDNSTTLSWNENGSATSWVLQYGTDNTFVTYTEETVNTTPSFDLTGLTALTTYYARVKPDCDADETHWSNPATFTTTAVAEEVGDAWNDDFEGAECGWELINGDLTNANWAWGTAVNNGGTHALYISNDGGNSNAYNNSGYAVVFATKLLNFADGKYAFSYDWKCDGEGSFDNLRVGLVPASTELVAHNTSTNTVPGGWVALYDGNYLSEQTTWQSVEKAIQVAAGNYYLVLRWRQDNSGGDNPPAAVDNVSIIRIACGYDVEGLAVNDDEITTTTAAVAWTAGQAEEWQVAFKKAADSEWTLLDPVSENAYTLTDLDHSTNYQVKVRAYCGGEDFGSWCNAVSFATACGIIPAVGYAENFDSYTSASGLLPLCWSRINTGTSYTTYPYISSSGNYSAPNCLYFYTYGSGSTTTISDQYAVLPEMSGLDGKQITLFAKGYSSSSTFTIGLMEDPADVSTFREIATQALTTSYQEYFYLLSGEGNYVAIMMPKPTGTASASYGVYIDDITITDAPSCLKPTDLEATASGLSATCTWVSEVGSYEIAHATVATADPAENVAGTATEATYTMNELALGDHYFWVRANCGNDGNSEWAGPVSVHIGYCVPAPTSVDNDGILTVTFGTGDNVVANTTHPSTSPYYGDYSAQIGAVQAGAEATIDVEYSTHYTYNTYVWVDWNNDLAFDATEVLCYGECTSSYPTTLSLSFIVPATQATGDYRLRIGGADSGLGSNPDNANPCYTGSYGIFEDYTLRVLEAPACMTPINLAVNYSGGTTAEVSWTSEADAWDVYVNDQEYATNITENRITLEDLDMATTYTVTVQAICGNTRSELSNPITFTTDLCMPENMCEITFELTDSWGDGWNGASIKVLDVATGEILGQLANENINGTTGTGTNELNVKTLSVCDGREIQFVWVSGSFDGEASYVVYDINEEEIFSGSGAMSEAVNYTVNCIVTNCRKPSDLAAVSGPQSLEVSWTENGEATSWIVAYKPADSEEEFIEEEVSTNPYTIERLELGTDYIVKVRPVCEDEAIMWSDEVILTTSSVTCPTPTNISVVEGSLTANSATLEWTGFNDGYIVYFGEHVYLFYEDFENGLDDWTIYTEGEAPRENGWYTIDPTSGLEIEAKEGTQVVSSWSWNNGAYDADNWLVTPQLPLHGTLSFWVRTSGGYPDSFEVLASTATNAIEDFTYTLREMTEATGEWTQIVIHLEDFIPDNQEGYIAIHHVGNDNNYLLVDLFEINSFANLEGTQIITEESTVNLEDLIPEKTYGVSVQGYCGTEYPEYTVPSHQYFFTTLPSCLAPTNFEMTENNTGDHTYTLTWDDQNVDPMYWSVDVTEVNSVTGEVNGWSLEAEGSPFNNFGEGGLFIPETEYTVRVVAVCSETDLSAPSNEISFITGVYCNAPTDLSADESTITSSSATVSWEGENDGYEVIYVSAETEASEDWKQYDQFDEDLNNVSFYGQSSSAQYTWGVMYPSRKLDERTVALSKVSIFESQYNTEDITINIYSGGEEAPEELLYTQTVTSEADNAFHEITLDGLVNIDPTQNVWITLTETGTYILSTYSSSDPNNQWYYTGNTWANSGITGKGWMIRAGFAVIDGELWEGDYVEGGESQFELTELEPGTTYFVQVSGYCNAEDYWGISRGTATTFTTLPGCPVPTDLTVVPDAFDAFVDWTAGGEETQWTIDLVTPEETYTEQVEVTTVLLSEVFPNVLLEPETEYIVSVYAYCGVDNKSNPVSETFTTVSACPNMPTDVAVDPEDVTAHEAIVTWEGSGEAYNVQYREKSGIDEGFEGYVIPDGWTIEGNGTWTVNTGDYSSSTGAHSGSYNAMITHSTDDNETYLVTPSMNLANQSDLTLNFWYINRSWGGDVDGFGVYYRVNGGDWNELFSTSVAHSTWTEVTIPLEGLADHYQLGFMMHDNYGYGVGLDDISLVIPAAEWTTIYDIDEAATMLEGLLAETTYEVQVQTDCGDYQSAWSESATFTTGIACPAPTDLAIEADADDVTTVYLSWEPAGNETSWIVTYYTDPEGEAESVEADDYLATLDGLTPETYYYVSVQANCGNDGYSMSLDGEFETGVACPAPEEILVEEDVNSAYLVWGDEGNYNLQYREAGHPEVIIEQDFNDGMGDWTMDNCHNSTGIYENAFRFYYSSNPPQYLISPEINMTENGTIEFKYKCNSSYYPETFKLGLSSTTNSPEAFDWSEEYTVESATYQTFNAPIPAGTKYIAIQHTSDDQFYLYIDDIVVNTMVGIGEWQDVSGITDNSYTIEGLEPATEYEVQVQADCGQYQSAWISTSFTTQCVKIYLTEAEDFVEDFESYIPEGTTTGLWTGYNPTCWTWNCLVDVPQDTMPQIYRSFASSGSYSLRMHHQGKYAMPELVIEEGHSINDVRLSFWMRNSYRQYSVEIGIANDLSDMSYVPIAVANSRTSNIFHFECNFADYDDPTDGEGPYYIVFKNNSEWVPVGDVYAVAYLDDITLSLNAPAECAYTTVPSSESFEDYTVPRSNFIIEPDCWTVVPVTEHIKDVPQVYNGFAQTGDNSLRMKDLCIYAMPMMDPEVDIRTVKMSMFLRQPKAIYKLQVGVMTGLDAEDFIPVVTLNNQSTNLEYVEFDFSSFEGTLPSDGYYIAFKNTLISGAEVNYSYNYIDDIELSYLPECGIESLPWSENFEGMVPEFVTATATGIAPDCWKLAQCVRPSASTKPQLFAGYDAGSGDYSLRLKNLCVYAMPKLADGIDLSNAKMEFYLRQPKKAYTLEVGVMSNLNDMTTYQKVKRFNLSETDMQLVEVDFSTFNGDLSGRYIVFRNTLISSATMDYSYNYIDGILLYDLDNAPISVVNRPATVSEESVDYDNAPRGVEDATLSNLNIYPNPTTGTLNLSGIAQRVEVYSQIGSLMAVYENVNQINISNLSEGIYFLRVTMPEGVAVRKVVKR